jgi:hypothetical protein
VRKKKNKNKVEVVSNDSSIMHVGKTDTQTVGPTIMPEKPEDASTGILFWFQRSDFYVTGLDFVFARIAIVS